MTKNFPFGRMDVVRFHRKLSGLEEYQHIFHKDIMVDKLQLHGWYLQPNKDYQYTIHFDIYLTQVQNGEIFTYHLDLDDSGMFDWNSAIRIILDVEELK